MRTYITMIIIGCMLASVLIINLPLMWFETFFHELSHGIVFFLTGNELTTLKLNWDGSGWIGFDGEGNLYADYAGYSGAPLWGSLIFLFGREANEVNRNRFLLVIAILIIVVTFSLANDSDTYIISGLLIFVLGIIFFQKTNRDAELMLEFIGIYVILNAIHSPLYILNDGDRVSDGYVLEQMTNTPEMLYILSWWLIAVVCLFIIAIPYAGRRQVA